MKTQEIMQKIEPFLTVLNVTILYYTIQCETLPSLVLHGHSLM